MEIEGNALATWGSALNDPDLWGEPLPNLALREVNAVRPTKMDQAQTLISTVRSAGRNPQRLRQLDELFQCYRQHVPDIVFNASFDRTIKTVAALFAAGFTADEVRKALRMGNWRDAGAHISTALAAYLGGFATLNGAHLEMTRAKAKPSTRELFAPLALAIATPLMQRLLRKGEMNAGWTRNVATNSSGAPVAMAETVKGSLVTLTQYWPFAISLGLIDGLTPDPAEAGIPADEALARTKNRLAWRIATGFASTAFVALHRLYFSTRDPVWLDASTPAQEAAMIGAINRLTSFRSTAADLIAYLTLRPMAGIVGLVPDRFDLDLIPPITRSTQAIAGVASPNPEQDANSIPRLDRRSFLDTDFAYLACRVMVLVGALYAASKARDAVNSSSLREIQDPTFRSVVNSQILLFIWGTAIAVLERAAASAPNLTAENKARAGRQLAINARYVAPPATAQRNEGALPPQARQGALSPMGVWRETLGTEGDRKGDLDSKGSKPTTPLEGQEDGNV